MFHQLLSNRSWIAAGFIFVLFIGTACLILEENPVTGNRRALGFTWEQELQIGRESDEQIIAEFGMYDDPVVAEYVYTLSKNILQHSHMRREGTSQQFLDTPFTFRVLDSDVVNAFALPGGFIYVTRGLMTHLNNEAQLAVVIGHEIAHVAARHASQRVFTQQAGSLLLIGGAVLGQELFGMSADNILNIGGTAAQLLFLSYSREAERESDRLGVEYAAMEGYDASEAAEFFRSLRRLSERSGQVLPNHLSSHPDPGDREASMHSLSDIWRERGFPQTIIREQEYMSIIDGMTVGENPRNGFMQNSVYYHPELKFLYPVPSGWRLINQPTQVVAFEENQRAVSIFRFAQGASNAREAVEQFTNQDGISVISSSRRDVNGIRGHRAIGTATGSDGTNLKFMVQGIEYDGNIFRFLNYSSENDYGSFESSFNQITNGFNRLEDPEILNIQPVRIQVVAAPRTGRFESFLPAEMPLGMTKDEFAIMNQLELTDFVTIGQLLKLPVQ